MVINESKSEEYEIIRHGNEKWKKCKLLGSLLDTEKGHKPQQILAIDAFKTLKKLLTADKSAMQPKSEPSMHMLQVYSSTTAKVLWTLTKKTGKYGQRVLSSKENILGKS